MHDRVLDISSTGGKIRFENSLLVLELKDRDKTTLPVSDIAVLILDNSQLVITQPALSALSRENVSVVITDRKHLPSGMILPLHGNNRQTEFFTDQAFAPLPVRKRAWKEIIKSKIERQAEIMEELYGDDSGIRVIASAVRSGDSTNREGYAAQKYWSCMGIISRRDRNMDDANIFLNYGYSVLHATASRSVCGAGLHPTIGINHHHRNNPFCLASDVMEPFRPLVDYTVWNICRGRNESQRILTKAVKRELLSVFTRRILVSGELISIFSALSGICVALRKRFSGEDVKLPLPQKLIAERVWD